MCVYTNGYIRFQSLGLMKSDNSFQWDRYFDSGFYCYQRIFGPNEHFKRGFCLGFFKTKKWCHKLKWHHGYCADNCLTSHKPFIPLGSSCNFCDPFQHFTTYIHVPNMLPDSTTKYGRNTNYSILITTGLMCVQYYESYTYSLHW